MRFIPFLAGAGQFEKAGTPCQNPVKRKIDQKAGVLKKYLMQWRAAPLSPYFLTPGKCAKGVKGSARTNKSLYLQQ